MLRASGPRRYTEAVVHQTQPTGAVAKGQQGSHPLLREVRALAEIARFCV